MDKDLLHLKKKIEIFTEERQWNKYHSPKNLAMALSKEASEIVEIFQWLTEKESQNLSEKDFEHLEEEIGDVMVYLINLSSKFGIDPIQAALSKMEKNKKKYPSDKFQGNWR